MNRRYNRNLEQLQNLGCSFAQVTGLSLPHPILTPTSVFTDRSKAIPLLQFFFLCASGFFISGWCARVCVCVCVGGGGVVTWG